MRIMLYGKYARSGVTMLQGLVRQLGLTQKKDDIGLVREALSLLPAPHPTQWIRSYKDLGYEGGLVDAFLHKREASFCVDDCLDLLDENDLKLRWVSEIDGFCKIVRPL